MSRDAIISLLRANRAKLDELHVKALGIYGSVARGDDDADSDVDILVEFEGDVDKAGLLVLHGFLEGIIESKVDLHGSNEPIPGFNPLIMRDLVAVPPYPKPKLPTDKLHSPSAPITQTNERNHGVSSKKRR
jgi:predicted nucleotidyltransferase